MIYVGDDVTDEDAFAALDADDVGVKVGQGKSIADLPACAAPRTSPSCSSASPMRVTRRASAPSRWT